MAKISLPMYILNGLLPVLFEAALRIKKIIQSSTNTKLSAEIFSKSKNITSVLFMAGKTGFFVSK